MAEYFREVEPPHGGERLRMVGAKVLFDRLDLRVADTLGRGDA